MWEPLSLPCGRARKIVPLTTPSGPYPHPASLLYTPPSSLKPLRPVRLHSPDMDVFTAIAHGSGRLAVKIIYWGAVDKALLIANSKLEVSISTFILHRGNNNGSQ